MDGNVVKAPFCSKVDAILQEMYNVPHLKEKALADLVNGLEVGKNLITYKSEQGFFSRCIGALDGSNRRCEIIIQKQTQTALETLTDWMIDLTREASFTQEGVVKIANKLQDTRNDLMEVGKVALENRHAILFLERKLTDLGQNMNCELGEMRSRLEKLELKDTIDEVMEAWKSGRLFKGYPVLIQGAFAIDNLLRGSQGERIRTDTRLKAYLSDKVVNILSEAQDDRHLYGSLARVWLPQLKCNHQVKSEVTAFGLYTNDKAPLHCALAAIVSTGTIPDWVEQEQRNGMQVQFDCEDLTEELIHETALMD